LILNFVLKSLLKVFNSNVFYWPYFFSLSSLIRQSVILLIMYVEIFKSDIVFKSNIIIHKVIINDILFLLVIWTSLISQSDNQRHFSFVGNLDIFDLTKWYCQYQWSDYDIVSINEATMILSVSMKWLWYHNLRHWFFNVKIMFWDLKEKYLSMLQYW
jgi:hypothetical protein